MKNKKGKIIWFVGLSGSGKSTLAKILKNDLVEFQILDGDILRKNITQHLGFTKDDRWRNIEIAADIAELLINNGVNVISTFMTPYKEMITFLNKRFNNNIKTILCSCDLKILRKRDPKKLYKLYDEGKIRNMCGCDAVFNAFNTDFVINTNGSIESSTDKLLQIIKSLRKIGFLE